MNFAVGRYVMNKILIVWFLQVLGNGFITVDDLTHGIFLSIFDLHFIGSSIFFNTYFCNLLFFRGTHYYVVGL